jgi:hypothetical protein
MTNNKQYRVESGEERWDYDSDVPTGEVLSYWVKLGDEKIKSFSYHKDAVDYANKLNNAINSVR